MKIKYTFQLPDGKAIERIVENEKDDQAIADAIVGQKIVMAIDSSQTKTYYLNPCVCPLMIREVLSDDVEEVEELPDVEI